MKIGLLFGTFNPIHKGHVEIANNRVLKKLINQVWFVVTPQNPFKKDQIITSQKHRIVMATLAIHKYKNFFISEVESQLNSPQYTSDTLRYLKKTYLTHEFIIVMGEDNYKSLLKHEWKDAKYILNNFVICVYRRTDMSRSKKHKLTPPPLHLSQNHIELPGEIIDYSSSLIRTIICNQKIQHESKKLFTTNSTLNKPPNFLHQQVFEYIKKNKLYIN